MAIWCRQASGADSMSPIEQQVIDDLAAPGADAVTGLAGIYLSTEPPRER